MFRWQRDRLDSAELIADTLVALLFPGQLQHLLRRVEADHLSVESSGQRFRKASGSAAQVENARYRVSFQMGRDRVHPEVEHLWAVIARAIVACGDIGLIVVGHRSVVRSRVFGLRTLRAIRA